MSAIETKENWTCLGQPSKNSSHITSPTSCFYLLFCRLARILPLATIIIPLTNTTKNNPNKNFYY